VTNTCIHACCGCLDWTPRANVYSAFGCSHGAGGVSAWAFCKAKDARFARSGPTGGRCWVCRACKGAGAYAATAFAAIAAVVGASGRPRATLPDRGMPARPPQPPVCQRRRQNAGRRAADPRQKRGRGRWRVNAEQFLSAGGARAKARPPMAHTLCGASGQSVYRMPPQAWVHFFPRQASTCCAAAAQPRSGDRVHAAGGALAAGDPGRWKYAATPGIDGRARPAHGQKRGRSAAEARQKRGRTRLLCQQIRVDS